MDDEPETYEMGQDEQTFVKTVAIEFAMIQMFRELLKDKFSQAEIQALCDGAFNRCESFNKELNAEGTPQSEAWKKQLTVDFGRIFGGISSNHDTWDEL